ncbi:MAG: hypothetical protein J5841_03660 [Clostridia bacterium]|nr:hypothetical protein [Clostridia bacterium]
MKKLLSWILCLCLLLGTAAYAEEEAEDDNFLLKIYDRSGLDISYLRFDFYVGNQYRGYVCSSPDEGEDFYRCPYSTDNPEELKDLRIEVSYGVSDLSPEDAIIQVMMGKEMEEHKVTTLEQAFELGKEYAMSLIRDGETLQLIINN